MKVRSWGAVFAVLLVLLVSACATTRHQTLLTPDLLEAAGQQFVQVAGLYNEMLEAETITVEQYRTWAVFGKRFQKSYPAAVTAWKAASTANDLARLDALQAEIKLLLAQLSKFASDAYAASK